MLVIILGWEEKVKELLFKDFLFLIEAVMLKALLMNIDIMLGHFTSYETSNVKKLLFLVLTELDEFLWAFKHTDLEKVAEYKSRIVNNLARKDGLIEFFRGL